MLDFIRSSHLLLSLRIRSLFVHFTSSGVLVYHCISAFSLYVFLRFVQLLFLFVRVFVDSSVSSFVCFLV